MQIAAAIALSVLYLGIALAWGGVHPGAGPPWWIFAPFIVMFFAAVLAWRMSALLSVPWIGGGGYGSPPRRVHLSWRTTFHIPVAAPVLVIAYHLHGSLSRHFDLGWVLYVVAAIAAIAVAAVARQPWREVGLLRNGEMALHRRFAKQSRRWARSARLSVHDDPRGNRLRRGLGGWLWRRRRIARA